MSRKLFTVPQNWREYVACLVIVGICPLLPILAELVAKGSANTSSLLISSAIYCLSIGFVTKSIMLFAVSIPNLFFLTLLHGITFSKYENSASIPAGYHWFAVGTIIIWSVILIMSKYNEHVIDGKLFWEMGRD